MEKVLCRNCGNRHHSWEDHVWGEGDSEPKKRRKPGKRVRGVVKVKEVVAAPPVDLQEEMDRVDSGLSPQAKYQAKWRREHPEKHAEQQRAYRERKKGGVAD